MLPSFLFITLGRTHWPYAVVHLRLLSLGLLLLCCVSLQAQDSLLLREAVVTHQRFDQRELLPAQRLEGKTLRLLGGVGVADALRQFSGVQLKDYGGVGGLKTINVRGMGTQHVGVFFDGIALSQAQNGQIDLGRFSLDDLEALTVYNGERTRLLQSARDFATASALYLESRTPSFNGLRHNNLRLRFRLGAFGTLNPSMTYEHRLSSNLSTSLSAEWLQTTGRYDFRYRTIGGYDTTATRRNGDVKAWRTEWGLFGNTSKGYWRTKVYLYTSQRGLPGAVVRNRFAHEDRQWDTNVFLQSSWRYAFTPRYALLLNAKWGYNYLHYLSDPAQGDLSAMYADNTYRHTEGYISVAQRYKIHDLLSGSVAVDYGYDHLNANLYRFAFPTRHSLYTATSLRFMPRNMELQATLLSQWTTERGRTSAVGPSRHRLSPSLSLSYRLPWIEGLCLRAFFKDIQRLPTMMEQYYTIVGTSNLRPETSQQWTLGVNYQRAQWEVKVDAYYNKVRDKIVAIPTSNMFRWTMLNLGRVGIRGVELALGRSLDFGDVHTRVRTTYTYERALDLTDPADAYYRHQIPYIPRHSGSFMAEAHYRRWALTYSFIYTGERYEQRANTRENFTPAWYTSDAALTYAIPHWQFTFQVSNLFNQRYEVVKGYPMPGTNCRLTVAWTLD